MRDRRALMRPVVLAALCASLFSLAACGQNLNLRRELGLVGEGPDEFTVVKRKPLVLPASSPSTVEELPTPKPGAPSPLDPQPEQEAQRALAGSTLPASSGAASAAETSLLSQAGATEADDGIRTQLAEDQEYLVKGTIVDNAVADVVELVSGERAEERYEDPLDPAAEARRLSEEAKSSGKNPDLQVPSTGQE